MKTIKGRTSAIVFTDTCAIKSGVYLSTVMNFLSRYSHFTHILWNGKIYIICQCETGMSSVDYATEYYESDLIDV